MTKLEYVFEERTSCEMCKAPIEQAKTLGIRLNRSQGRSPRGQHGIAVGVMKCGSCDLIFANPLPIPKSLSDHYDLAPEDYWVPEYFEEDPRYFAREVETAKRLLPFKDGMTALDIGAGLGKAMLALERGGFQAFGIEPSPAFREAAISRMGIPPERLNASAIESAVFDQKFDFITFGAVLEHIYHPAEAIGRALQWLKPGGVIQIEVPSSSHLIAKILNLYYRVTGTNFVTHLSPMHPPFHLYEFGLQSFLKHGAAAGYVVAEHEYHQNDVLFVPIPKLLHPVLSRRMAKTKTGMQLTVWLRPKPEDHVGIG